MTIDAIKMMRLQGWLSPAFPIGAYSYSHALEWAVESGAVRDRATLVDWLEADLRFGAGRADGIFLAEAWRAVAGERISSNPDRPQPLAPTLSPWERERRASVDALPPSSRMPATVSRGDPPWERERGGQAESHPTIIAIAELAAAMRGTAELVLESGQQGVAFLAAVRKAWPHPELDRLADTLKTAGITPVLPVAAGIACAFNRIPLDLALPLYLHAGAANLINAAVRLIPLGQSDGQKAMAALEIAAAETAAEAMHAGISGLGSAAFMIDIASMRHETQYTRLFRS
jgi:urease accessory protein